MKTVLSAHVLALALGLSLTGFAGAGCAGVTQPGILASDAPMLDALILPSQYSAVLHSRAGRWEVLDPSGPRLQFETSACPSNVLLPPGLWLLTRDADNRPVLIAPSVTPLPAGHSGQISIRTCGSAQQDRDASASLQLPDALISTLEQHGSAILISN